MRIQVLLLVVALTPGAAFGQARKDTLTIQTLTKGQRAEFAVELFLPDGGAAKLPAMVIHHGSSGVSDDREYAYARELVKRGIAAIVPDSFTPRGVKSTVADQSAVTNNEFLADAFATLRAAVAHPRLDPARIGIMGFSKGGTSAFYSALAAQAERFAPGGPRFALHVPFYPSCANQYRRTETTGAPILLLMGGADTYVGTEACNEMAGKLKAAGAKIESVVYPNAQHGWDGGGRGYNIANGENFRKCVWVEQADGSWIERASGVQTHGPGGRPIEGAGAKALAGCRSYGVSGGPDAKAKAESFEALLKAMTEALRL